MTEADVRTAAGAPDKVVTGIGSTANADSVGAACQQANGTVAMLYSFEHCGWMCEHLDLMSGGSVTDVVCVDDQRIVVKTYLEIIHY